MLIELKESGTELFHEMIWINEGSFKLLGNVNRHSCVVYREPQDWYLKAIE